MKRPTALLDANVLYPAPLRDLLLQLSVLGVFRARWTAEIQQEWVSALLRNEPRRDRQMLERTCALMNQAIPDCLIRGHRKLLREIVLPDPQDRHVLAAAIHGRCDVLVTRNRKHFPPEVLHRFGVQLKLPDDFLASHLRHDQETFCEAARRIRARLKNPPVSAAHYLSTLEQQGLSRTVAQLRPLAQHI